MRHKGLMITLVLACVAILGSLAFAACVQGNLAGTWGLYVTTSDDVGLRWTRCTLTVAADGKIAAGAKCVDAGGKTSTITSGTMVLSDDCVVTGKLKAKDGLDVITATIKHGALERGKLFFTGVGQTDKGDCFTFTAVKK
jgi:hypothetical protein